MKQQTNHCNTEEEINEYFQEQDRKLWKKHGFVFGEMDKIWDYCRDHQELLDKCGDRLRQLKSKGEL